MNGRIYDPKLGRMLQADPFVQFPKYSQSLNRYSYVLNNPLSYTDPSGYFSFSRFVKKWGRVIAAAVATYFTAGLASGWAVGWGFAAGTVGNAAIAGAVAGFVGGGILTGTLKGAFYGGLTGAALVGIGATGWNNAAKSLASGAASGITTELQGGKFGNGFLSAGMGFWSGLKFGGPPEFGKFLVSALAGGTISELTGGKFANGAVSAGLAYVVAAAGASAQKQPGRALTAEERELGKRAFTKAFGSDDGFNYDAVRVIDGKFLPWQGEGYAMAPDGNIYWPGECGNLASCGGPIGSDLQIGTASTFVHEMTHVHQYQQGTNVLLRGMFVQAGHFLKLFDAYALPIGVPYSQLNIEQQGQFVSYQLFPHTVKAR